jgi:hypothetical protein
MTKVFLDHVFVGANAGPIDASGDYCAKGSRIIDTVNNNVQIKYGAALGFTTIGVITFGANDSGGAGYKVLRVPN